MHGASMAAHADQLDPTCRDMVGNPLLRRRCDFPENERRMASRVTNRVEALARSMDPRAIKTGNLSDHNSIVPRQTTHDKRGTIMGLSPADAVVSRYGQVWDMDDVFVTGASLFPQISGDNPTDTVGALTCWSAKAIREQYLASPQPLVDA